jgi:hypothetical protein
MSGDLEPASNDSEPLSLQKLHLDPLGQRLAHKFGMPVRRHCRLATISVPSGTLVLVDPTAELGVEVAGILARKIDVVPKVWSLQGGLSLVGGIAVNCAPCERQLNYGTAKIRNLGRVEVNSGVLAILDASLWSKRPDELRGDKLRQRIERQDYGEVVLDAATGERSVLLPTGYGAGKYAVVARFVEDRVVDLEVFMLKGNSP